MQTKKERTKKAYFLEDRVMFISGKRTFCSSGPVYRDGVACERAVYNLPLKLHAALLKKELIECVTPKKKAKK